MAQSRISGHYRLVPGAQGVDKVVLFEDLSAADAYIKYTGDSIPTWKRFDGSVVQTGTGTETLYPEDATGYLLYAGDSLVESFYVLDYQQYAPDLDAAVIAVSMQCDRTEVTLTADVPEMAYRNTQGRRTIIPHEAVLRFTTLGWDGENYQDSIGVETLEAKGNPKGQPAEHTFLLPPIYRNSEISLRMDLFVENWGREADSIVSEEAEAIAVCIHPTSVTTSRDYNGLGVENEPARPIDEGTLQGSAPIEINFKSNANKPVAEFFRWKIYKGSELIVERFDEDQRYTFMENGTYQVRVWAYNAECMTDSATFDISVSESLLRVPNAFTPNGDGTNDEFRVVYRSIEEFHCWIYNRWGKLVYQWDDPAKGWDGTINGRPAAEGAYYYIIRARGTDADPNGRYHKASIKRPAAIGVYQLSGNVNLLR